MNACPECGGLQLDDHPGGVLMILHANDCGLRDLEDARQVADYDRFNESPWRRRFTRPATATERILLAALGFSVPDVLDAQVEFLGPGVRSRRFDVEVAA